MSGVERTANIVADKGGKVSYKETFVRETTSGDGGLPGLLDTADSDLKAPLCCNGSGNYIVRNVFGYKRKGVVDVHSPQSSNKKCVMYGKNIIKLLVILVALTVAVGAVVVATGHGLPLIAAAAAGVAHLCAGTSMACITAKVASCVFAGVGSLIAFIAIRSLQITVLTKPMPKEELNFEPKLYTGRRVVVGGAHSTEVAPLPQNRGGTKTTTKPPTRRESGRFQMALGGGVGSDQAVKAHLAAAASLSKTKL